MKRAIQTGLFIILIGCLLITGIPGPDGSVAADCNDEAVVMIYAPWLAASWFDTYGHNNPVNYQITSDIDCLFQPQVRISSPTVSLALKKYTGGVPSKVSTQVQIQVWHMAYDAEREDYCPVDEEPVMDTIVNSALWDNAWHWVTVHDENAILMAEEYYGIVVKCLDSKWVCWGYHTEAMAFEFNFRAGGRECELCEDCGLDETPTIIHMGVLVQGCWAPPITVLTQDGYVHTNGNIVMGGLVTSMGISGEVKCYIDYGFTEELGNEEFVKNVNTVTPPGSYYNWQLSSWIPGSYIYFRARIVETSTGETGYGEIKEVLYPEVIPQISCDVVVNDAWDCTFETVISSIDDVEAVDLVLYYGLNWSCYGEPDSVTMFEDIDVAGVYRWNDITWGIFEPGRTYYYYAEEQTTESVTIVRSETKQFKRYDPNKPAWRNTVENWLAGLWGTADLPEINGWWILAVVVFLLVFFLTTRAKNWKLGLAWGMVAMMVLLYILVSNGLVDPWLVVLLTILAGFIIYKVIFAPVMHK